MKSIMGVLLIVEKKIFKFQFIILKGLRLILSSELSYKPLRGGSIRIVNQTAIQVL